MVKRWGCSQQILKIDRLLTANFEFAIATAMPRQNLTFKIAAF
jgi:hypothetical protein